MPEGGERLSESRLTCVNCGYNLTGAVIGGRCAECGAPIEESLRPCFFTDSGRPRPVRPRRRLTPPPPPPDPAALRSEYRALRARRRKSTRLGIVFGVPGIALVAGYTLLVGAAPQAALVCIAGAQLLLAVEVGFAARARGRSFAWSLAALPALLPAIFLLGCDDRARARLSQIKATLAALDEGAAEAASA